MNNQKKMSEEEKRIVQEKTQEKRHKESLDKIKLNEIKNEIFENKRANLPKIIQERTLEIAQKLKDEIVDIDGFDTPYIYELIANPNILSVKVKLTTTELMIAFQEFKKTMTEINRYTRQTPSIELFSAFIGISTNTYRNYLNDIDEERQNVMHMIDNYITGTVLESSKKRQIDSSTAMYTTKAQHGIVEQNAPQIVRHEIQTVDRSSLLETINKIKSTGTILDAEYKEK